MFDTTIDTRSRKLGALRRLASAPLAVAFHAAVLCTLTVAQAVDVRGLPEPLQIVSLWTPPGPPPGGDGRPHGNREQVKGRSTPKTATTQDVQIDRTPDSKAEPGKQAPVDDTASIGALRDEGTGPIGTDEQLTVKQTAEGPEKKVFKERAEPPGPDVVLPVAIERPEPRYPDLARRVRVAGPVVLQAVIDRSGQVIGVTVLRDPGLGLGQAAVDAVRTWRYRPTTRNGRPIAVLLTVTIMFRLS
jgi:periplasmic protein TonB